MTKILRDYLPAITSLPLEKHYTKEQLLTPDFLIESEGNIGIYYAAHNEYFNEKAKVFIVGITPGFAQMEKSIVAAREGIAQGLSYEALVYHCKKQARFCGVLRTNICNMLDELGLPAYLGIQDTQMLFGEADDLLHTTSMLPFATFVKGKNYTGHTPQLLKQPTLMAYVTQYFYPQVAGCSKCLVIPLGRCVEEVLQQLISQGVLREEQCLMGFPHPSGANVHRKVQFATEKEQMQEKLAQYFK